MTIPHSFSNQIVAVILAAVIYACLCTIINACKSPYEKETKRYISEILSLERWAEHDPDTLNNDSLYATYIQGLGNKQKEHLTRMQEIRLKLRRQN